MRLTLEFTDDEWTRLQTEAKRRRHKLEAWARNTLLDVAAAQAELTRIDERAARMRKP